MQGSQSLFIRFSQIMLILLSLNHAVQANTSEEAIAAFDKKDYPKAMGIFTKLGNGGNVDSQLYLAHLYENGLGTAKDLSMAFAWYQKAAQQGDARAQFNLAYAFKEGLGTPINLSQAIIWYEKAAKQNNAFAQHNLGFMHEHGLGTPKNLGVALSYYEKSSSNGNLYAQIKMADLLANPGSNEKHNPKSAIDIYQKILVQKELLTPVEIKEIQNKINILEASLTQLPAKQTPTSLTTSTSSMTKTLIEAQGPSRDTKEVISKTTKK